MKIDKWQGDDYPDCIEVSVQPISFFNNGSGGINACGQWMSEDEARELWEDAVGLEEPYPPFTGLEFIDNHETIDDHPYATGFGQFLGNGIDANVANELAFGIHSVIANISSDYTDPLRVKAANIFDRLTEMGYWADSLESDSEPNGFHFDDSDYEI